MADDDHSFGAAFLFLDLKVAASERFNFEQRQEVGGHAQALQAFGLLFIEQDESVWLVTRYRLKAPALRLPILQIKVRDEAFSALAFFGSPDRGHTVWLGEVRRIQDQRVDDAENRRVRANAQGQRQHGDQCEARLLKQ